MCLGVGGLADESDSQLFGSRSFRVSCADGVGSASGCTDVLRGAVGSHWVEIVPSGQDEIVDNGSYMKKNIVQVSGLGR